MLKVKTFKRQWLSVMEPSVFFTVADSDPMSERTGGGEAVEDDSGLDEIMRPLKRTWFLRVHKHRLK